MDTPSFPGSISTGSPGWTPQSCQEIGDGHPNPSRVHPNPTLPGPQNPRIGLSIPTLPGLLGWASCSFGIPGMGSRSLRAPTPFWDGNSIPLGSPAPLWGILGQESRPLSGVFGVPRINPSPFPVPTPLSPLARGGPGDAGTKLGTSGGSKSPGVIPNPGAVSGSRGRTWVWILGSGFWGDTALVTKVVQAGGG